MTKPYRDYSDYITSRFGSKMQKLTVNAGFTCPNRDGTVGRGGCTYCNNASFSPMAHAHRAPVAEQLAEGKRFFEHKYPQMRYLAYFQSYTNTHGEISRLLPLYREALAVDKVDGLIIGTRPDCVPSPLLRELAAMEAPVMMEYGAETTHNPTLEAINRCHTWKQTVDAVHRTADAGLDVGLHFIMGLPGETEEMMLESVERAIALPISTIKFHQLQLISGTPMARAWEQGQLPHLRLFDVDSYLSLCARIVALITARAPHIAIERFTSSAPSSLLLAPRWGLKNYEFTHRLHRLLQSQ